MACEFGSGKRRYVDITKTDDGDDKTNGHAEEEAVIVHHVPFKIEYEGQANVDVKFTGKSFPLAADSKVLCNQYRGRPLQGQKMDLPKDYEGLVATDLKKSSSSDGEGTGEKTDISIGKRFDSLTYWNWDRVPSGMDKHVKLVDWMELSQILHAPVGDV